jgi:hypothetical protein
MNDLWPEVCVGVVPFIFFFCWLMFPRRKCPDCGTSLPPFVWPFTKTKRQWWAGGWICPNCGIDVDMPASWARAVKWLPAMTALWGAVLLVFMGIMVLWGSSARPPIPPEPLAAPRVIQPPMDQQH